MAELYSYRKKESEASQRYYSRKTDTTYCTLCRKTTQSCSCGKKAETWSAESKFTKTGVRYNEETGILSLYTGGYIWFVPKELNKNVKNDLLLKRPVLTKLSYNLKTGRITNTVKTSRYTDYRCINNHTSALTLNYQNEDSVQKAKEIFIQELCKRTGLETLLERRHEMKNFCITNALDAAIAPNLAVVHDKFSGNTDIREDYPYLVYVMSMNKELDKFRKKQPRQVMDANDYIKYMINVCKAPRSKAFLKLYHENPLFIGWAGYIYNTMRVKELSNIMKLIDIIRDSVSIKTCSPIKACFSIKDIFKGMAKACGETNAVNKVIKAAKAEMASKYVKFNDTLDALEDTNRMYKAVRKGMPDVKCDLTGSISDIHDRVTELSRILEEKKANTPIPYQAKELERQWSDGVHTIAVAKDVHKLIDIGQKMHICVGSYREPVLSKKCTIYYMYLKETGKYEACFEIQGNKLVQAKGYCNEMLKGDAAKVMKTWTAEKKINVKGCYDYKNAA